MPIMRAPMGPVPANNIMQGGVPNNMATFQQTPGYPGGVAWPFGGVAGTEVSGLLPSYEEITSSMQHAYQMACFMRQQTEFWMQQVQSIQQQNSSGGAGLSITGFPSPPPQLLAKAKGMDGPSSGSGSSFSTQDVKNQTLSSSSSQNENDSDVVPVDEMPSSAGGAALSELAAIRRQRSQQWEARKRASTSSAGETSPGEEESQAGGGGSPSA